MFSVIPAGRPCLTDFLAVSATQFAVSFPSTPVFSHLVVFMIPGNTLHPDTGAGVYIKLPGKNDFQFLGAIGNEKPSAIFKIRLPVTGNAMALGGDEDAMIDTSISEVPPVAPGALTNDIELGISVEPIANIQTQLETLESQRDVGGSARSKPPNTKELAQGIIKNAFNFLAGFAGSQGGQEVVPLKSFEDWWAKFERRIENDPEFLQRDNV